MENPNTSSTSTSTTIPSKHVWVFPNRTKNLTELYTLGRELGCGTFGITYLCTEKSTGCIYACKTIPKKKLLIEKDYEDVRREVQIMHHLAETPNVVKIHGTYEDSSSVHLVMEFCEGGELFDRILTKGHYSEREAAKLMKTVVEVVETCHSLGVMHRDLKPENFLFDSVQEDAKLKAIDFGLSVFYQPGATRNDAAGSLYYIAPEVLQKNYGPEMDVWSAGVILYILLCGDLPFQTRTEISGGELKFQKEPWPSISDSAKDLIRKMLDRNPKTRLTAHEVLCHPWIVDDNIAPDKPLDSAVLTRLKQFSAMNKLKKVALRVIAERLSEEEIAGLKELFKMIDTDKSGTITFDELKDGLKRVGAELLESEIKDLMDAADIDNSGTIDYGEFIAATLHLNKLEREENLMLVFSYFDKDGSGYITIDKIQQACKDFGMNDIHIDEMVKEIFHDGDGQINYDEFAAMIRKNNGGTGRRTMRSTLNF
ncbi:hypothetical protein TanjilG_11552 [Lupinus angustifolius]|uniref:non-specific serine/threonine protein kinase n=1 Tax=Lupinus angustifolius TaxID=3871 RepID=A0A394DQ39_LUPAN|nr:PREDICTED: calcium-dependent protein kinase SK5-like [Lupinus angustifolius]OIW21817.1 hypothetical protein TanjilG_11552 [Lupinus angustifolius]